MRLYGELSRLLALVVGVAALAACGEDLNAWKYQQLLYLDTKSDSGAHVSSNVDSFPVLVRLTAGNFTFSQARNRGNDIRFTDGGKIPLSYEIEQWDSTNSAAAIWVSVPVVKGNDSTAIRMYWGNNGAVTQSNGAAVFDTANAFLGVWHLGEMPNGIN
jgi:biopolymer transport protein ExbB